MTVTIDLTPQEEADLTAAARQEGLDPPALVKRLMARFIPSSVTALSEDALREEYHRLADRELRNALDDAQRRRLRQIREELDDREAARPAVRALLQRLDQDDARLDRLLHLLETRFVSSPGQAEQ